jgi:hypothetical protein
MKTALLFAALLAFGASANAQWLNYRVKGTPVTKDGKVDLSAPAPRGADGHPILTGVWHNGPGNANEGGSPPLVPVPTGGPVDPKLPLSGNVFKGLKVEDVPEKPEAAKIRYERTKDGLRATPTLSCLPAGIPVNNLVLEVVKFIQSPDEIVVLHELDGTYRQIYLDGRPLPQDPNPSWLGYSTGHWEGNTLVVETAGFNDKSWLDSSGHGHSEALHLTERYTRRDYGHMDVEMTFNDPVMYTRPFSIKFTHWLQADSDILESYCNENERDRKHLIGVDGVRAK